MDRTIFERFAFSESIQTNPQISQITLGSSVLLFDGQEFGDDISYRDSLFDHLEMLAVKLCRLGQAHPERREYLTSAFVINALDGGQGNRGEPFVSPSDPHLFRLCFRFSEGFIKESNSFWVVVSRKFLQSKINDVAVDPAGGILVWIDCGPISFLTSGAQRLDSSHCWIFCLKY